MFQSTSSTTPPLPFSLNKETHNNFCGTEETAYFIVLDASENVGQEDWEHMVAAAKRLYELLNDVPLFDSLLSAEKEALADAERRCDSRRPNARPSRPSGTARLSRARARGGNAARL